MKAIFNPGFTYYMYWVFAVSLLLRDAYEEFLHANEV